MHFEYIFNVEAQHGARVFREADIDRYFQFLVQVLLVDDQVTALFGPEMIKHSHCDEKSEDADGNDWNASSWDSALA